MQPSELSGLDKTKFSRRTFGHSNSSQRVVGYYPEGMTKTAVEELVHGTFGGRFNHFGGGTYEYIAHTD